MLQKNSFFLSIFDFSERKVFNDDYCAKFGKRHESICKGIEL